MFGNFNLIDQDQATFSSSSDQEDALSLIIGDVRSLLDMEGGSKKSVKVQSRNNSPSKNVYRDLQNTTERCALKDLVLDHDIKGDYECNVVQNVDKGPFNVEDVHDKEIVNQKTANGPNTFDLNKEPVILFQPEMKNWGGMKDSEQTEDSCEELYSDNGDTCDNDKSDTVPPNQPPPTPESIKSFSEQENNKNPILFHNLFGDASKDILHESDNDVNCPLKRLRSPELETPIYTQIPKKKVKAKRIAITNGDSDGFVSNPEVGTLVWAKIKGFPPWPAMVAPDPNGKLKDKMRKKDAGSGKVDCYHVIFLESANQRAWIQRNFIALFTGIQGKKYSGSRAIAVKSAETMYAMDIEERLENFDRVQVTAKEDGKQNKKKRAKKFAKREENPYYQSGSESDSGTQPDTGMSDENDCDAGVVEVKIWKKLSMTASVRLRRLPLPTNSATISFRRMGDNEFKCRVCHKIFSKKVSRDFHEQFFHVKSNQGKVEPMTSVFVKAPKTRVPSKVKSLTSIVIRGENTPVHPKIKPLNSVFVEDGNMGAFPKVKPLFIKIQNLKTDKNRPNPKVIGSSAEGNSNADADNSKIGNDTNIQNTSDTYTETGNDSNTEAINDTNTESIHDTNAETVSDSDTTTIYDSNTEITKTTSQLHWFEGDLVWAKMAGWCYWPCLVSLDPSHSLTSVTRPTGTYTSVHVTFLAYGGQHAWVGERSIIRFVGMDQFKEEKKFKKQLKNYIPKKSMEKIFWNAVGQASTLSDLRPDERLENIDAIILD